MDSDATGITDEPADIGKPIATSPSLTNSSSSGQHRRHNSSSTSHRSISTRTTNKCQTRATMPPPGAAATAAQMRPRRYTHNSVVQQRRRPCSNRISIGRPLLLFPASSSSGGHNSTRASSAPRRCLPRMFVLVAMWLCVSASIGNQQVFAAWPSVGPMNDKVSDGASLHWPQGCVNYWCSVRA